MAPKWKKPAADAPSTSATLTTPPAETSGSASPKPKAKAWGKAKASAENSETPAPGSTGAPKAKAWGKKKDTPEDSQTAPASPKPKAKGFAKKKKEELVEQEQPKQQSETAPVADQSGEGEKQGLDKKPRNSVVLAAEASALRRAEEAEARSTELESQLRQSESIANSLKSKLEEVTASELEQDKRYQAELVCLGDCKAQVRMEKEVESEAMKKVATILAKEHDSHVSELKAQLAAEQWRLQAVELEAQVQQLSSTVFKLEAAEEESKQAAERTELFIEELKSEAGQWATKTASGQSGSKVETLAASLNEKLDQGSLLLFKTDPRFWK